MRVNPYFIYKHAHGLLDTVTPCVDDCGSRCGSICCQDTDAGTGMYLYPKEASIYKIVPRWAKIEPSGFYYHGGEAEIFSCNGTCDRKLRPLACRIFPLVPYKKPGEKMKIIYDPRATAMCPLAPEELTPSFIRAVTKSMYAVVKLREVRAFIEAQSELIDMYVKFKL